MRGFFAATHALPTAEIVRFLRPYEGAHELAFNLRGDGLSIDPGALEKLADIFHPVDAGGFDLNSLKPSGFKFSALLLLFERPCHTARPQLYASPDIGRSLAPDYDI